ncbi:MAG: hypothetical protein EZS28_053361, partial [Streblomastix strix]
MVRISNVSVRDIQMMDGQNQLFPFVNFCLGNIQRQTSVAENTVNNDYLNERIELIYDPEKKKQELERKRKEALDSKYIKGFVKINNISVRNLPNTDVIGKPDPYVLIRMGMDEKQTSVAHNVNDYEYLNEKYEMEYDPVKMKGKKEVDIEVWDYDTAGFDDLVGSA